MEKKESSACYNGQKEGSGTHYVGEVSPSELLCLDWFLLVRLWVDQLLSGAVSEAVSSSCRISSCFSFLK